MAEQNQNRVTFKYGTYEDYVNLYKKDPNTVYFTTNPEHIFKGDKLYTAASNVIKLSVEEYASLKEYDEGVIYLIFGLENSESEKEVLLYIYVGSLLIAERHKDGSVGFPYEFPIIF